MYSEVRGSSLALSTTKKSLSYYIYFFLQTPQFLERIMSGFCIIFSKFENIDKMIFYLK